MTVLEEAAKFAKSVKFEDLDEEQLKRVKDSIVDLMGVAVAASREEDAKILHEYIREEAAAPKCSIWGTDIKTSMRWAAFANGTAGHLLDYDDNAPLVGHPATIITPALIAAAETVHATGKEVMTAYYAGFMVCNCLIKPIERKAWFRCWHLTPVAGIFGATTAAGLILGLTEEQLTMAYGITVSQCSSIQSNYGTPTKALGVGFAAAKAVDAVLLAKRGYRASAAAYEGDGYCRAYSGEEYTEELRPKFNKECGVPARRPQIKPYPACGGAHTFMESAMYLAKEYDIDPEQVEKIYVGLDKGGPHMLQCHNPVEPTGARFSVEYGTAGMLVHRSAGLKAFSQEAIDDPRVKDLIPKVEYEVSKEIEPYGVEWHPSLVRIYMKNGEMYERIGTNPKGTPKNPLTDEEFNMKFIECTEESIGLNASAALEEGNHLSDVKDINSLVNKLCL